MQHGRLYGTGTTYTHSWTLVGYNNTDIQEHSTKTKYTIFILQIIWENLLLSFDRKNVICLVQKVYAILSFLLYTPLMAEPILSPPNIGEIR